MDLYFGRNEAEEEYVRKYAADEQYKKLEAQLAGIADENIHALLTIEEAEQFVSIMKDPASYKQESGKEIFFRYAGIATSFTGNYLDAYGLGKLIAEVKSFGVKEGEYIGRDGSRYIRLTGEASLRKYLTATIYLITDPKMLEFGIGEVGFETNLAKGTRFCIYFSAAYRGIELLFRDEYDLTDFFVNVSMDAAKALIGMGIALLAKGLITTFVGIIGGGLIAISAGVFVVSLFVALGLYILDDYFGISKSIINELKNSKRGSKTQDLRHDFHQGFNLLGRYSRG
ncbi:hypothetical protein RNA47_000903 [Morganella morganii]|uniref:hypothetical protein n=1 Tax=Morganella morganii TaxID=582 RepID=UPI001BDAF926|nr:hypothetical protein [Morganella morganii]ELF0883176.1 hypothetical protein [Morganella morganii]MBT0388371.1 hypothetical protein [Morganella morganii subsp. morganii]HCR3197113.1 hypothetical protein [Morganella morganii]HEJ1048967.1 hypothetical protein [Morganella morganii]